MLRGAKGNIYDGGLRVPTLVNWKGKITPKKETTPIQGLDYFPTFLDLAGITDYSETLDGNSICPLLKGEKLADRNIFWHLPSRYKDAPCSIIRQGDWKLIQFHLNKKVELYNTKTDLAEKNDLIKTEPKKAAELLNALTNWRKEHNAPLPKSSKLKF